MTVEIPIMRLPHGADLALPAYATPASAGLDLCAAIDAPVILAANQRALIPTGIALALPEGYDGQVRPRSGLALKHGVTVLNSPGTIDADYRGEVKVLLINFGGEDFTIERGMRVAQLVVAPVTQVRLAEAAGLGESARGAGGFGSSGLAGAKAE